MTDFPAHYSDTAIAVLSLPGWVDDGRIGSLHEWSHDNGTLALVHADGTISTCRPTYDHDPWSDVDYDPWSDVADYMTADPIFQD